MRKILVVDDFEGNREILEDILCEYYEVDTASNGQEAIEKINQNTYNAMLLDLIMPVMDGYGVLNYLNQNNKAEKLPVIVISGDSGAETEGKCLDLGVEDFILKPFKEKVVLKRLNNVIALREYQTSLEGEIQNKNNILEKQNKTLTEQAQKLEEINNNIIEVLGNVVEFRNLESGTHVKRVKGFTKILGMQLLHDFPEYGLTDQLVEQISLASALHDIGKISIPDSILLKPGRLTPEEFDIMKTHTIKGCEILNIIDGIWDDAHKKFCYEICRYHHEKYDGKGYPDGLKGDEIPISAQIVSIADCYDALTTERVYKKAFPKEKAFQMIQDGECGVFSPNILISFRNAKKKFEVYADQVKSVIQ